jgi:hypothetical protein
MSGMLFLSPFCAPYHFFPSGRAYDVPLPPPPAYTTPSPLNRTTVPLFRCAPLFAFDRAPLSSHHCRPTSSVHELDAGACGMFGMFFFLLSAHDALPTPLPTDPARQDSAHTKHPSVTPYNPLLDRFALCNPNQMEREMCSYLQSMLTCH